MTSPPEEIQVRCPECGHLYEDWCRASMKSGLEGLDDEYLEEASTATCPKCGYKVDLGILIVSEDRMWQISEE